MIQFNSETEEFIYKNKVVGSWKVENGHGRFHLDITYEVDDVGISLGELLPKIAEVLKIHAEKEPPMKDPIVILETDEIDVEPIMPARRTLTEVTIKRGNHKWRFHLNDADPWPSIVHGHDYERNLKLDAFTGYIYDISTRNHCETLKKKKLNFIVAKLKENPEFKHRLESTAGLAT
ncbi:MAG: hypothetical protein DI586_03405 [Micavibrio aeruginosavorus]|uniref:Uncharacterized protein n=1 Tax=Micavibrio aeruginosavorus TaxID=349221 RepID=A0A2W5HEG3_9BACT|nr:MAG: hypothetical protein DI586_03405 [Micavibrio aeruginosavorus]